jgi:dihydrofolate reductase
MPRLSVFNHVTLDGYFTDRNGDMSWAHNDDAEFRAFTESNASGGGRLLLGRVTYGMMAGFWPTPMAAEMMPSVAERMNNLPKVVFSRTLDTASWNNAKLVSGDITAGVRKMKEEPGEDMVILGSGSIIAQLAQEGLIDEYQLIVNPVVLGSGRTMFEGVQEKLNLQLTKSRVFGNGSVLLCYAPFNNTH